MTVREQILEMLREKSPRTNREFALAIYGTGDLNSKVQISNRLKPLVQAGHVRAQRTGAAQNAVVLYHLAEPAEYGLNPVAQLDQIQKELEALIRQVAHVRIAISS